MMAVSEMWVGSASEPLQEAAVASPWGRGGLRGGDGAAEGRRRAWTGGWGLRTGLKDD